jgi:hypothetical protein
MTSPYVAATLAHEYQRDRISAAARGRLAALARCCRPSQIAQAFAALRTRLGGRPRRAAACSA